MDINSIKLFEKVLDLFYINNDDEILISIFRSAEKESIYLPKVDEKYKKSFDKFNKRRYNKEKMKEKGIFKNIFYSFREKFLDRNEYDKKIATAKYGDEEAEYTHEKLKLAYEIDEFRNKNIFDDNTNEIFNMLEYYLTR